MKQTPRQGCKRIVTLLLATVLMVGAMLVPTSAGVFPIVRTYIQTTIDTSTWEILAGVISWESTPIGGDQIESKRIKIGTREQLAGSEYPSAVSSSVNGTQVAGGFENGKNLVLSFPGAVGTFGLGTWDDSKSIDTNRASLIRNSLIYDLNEAFRFVYGTDWKPSGSSPEDKVESYGAAMSAFLACVPNGSMTVDGNAVTFSTASTGEVGTMPDEVTLPEDYVKITKNGKTEVFQYRMVKGYVDVRHSNQVLGLSKLPDNEDAKYVHWGTLAVEAFYNYKASDELRVSSSTVYDSKPSAIEKAIAQTLGGFCDWLANVLGLWSFDELIFNAGTRGSAGYIGGVFPASWEQVIWSFFFVSEIAALVILLYAIIYNVGKKVMSTIDPVARASAIEQIKYLFIVAIILGILPYAITVLINMSAEMTGVFHDALGSKTATERFRGLAQNSGGLGSILTYLLYLGALVYFNVFYVFRSLAVSLLIIVSPIFVAMMALNENKRYLTITWFKEFCSTLFIQPLQAIMLSFILLVPPSGRHIESIIMAYVMIPLTNMLRQVFFGGAGGMGDIVGQKGQQSAKRTAVFAGGLGLAAAGGAIGGAISAVKGSKEEDKKEQNGSEGGSSNNSPSTPPPATKPANNGTSGTGVNNDPSHSTDGQSPDMSGGSKPAAESSAERVDPGSAVSKPSTASSQAAAGMDAGASTNDAGSSSDAGNAPGSSDNAAGSQTAGSQASGSAGGDRHAFKGAATIAGAVALGALGGGMDYVGRRVFGLPPGRNGGLVTQLSRTMGAKGGQMMRGSSGSGSSDSNNPPASPGGAPMGGPSDSDILDEAASGTYRDGTNIMARGLADRTTDGDTSTYSISPDNMKDAGIRGIHGSGQGESVVQYDMNKMGAEDQARMNQMMAMWQNGSPEEISAMQDAGIADIQPVTKMQDGQEVTSGVNVTYNNDAAKANFGINTAPASNGGKGMEVTAPGDSAPAIVPDVASYMNGPMPAARAFTSRYSASDLGIATVGDNAVTITANSPEAMTAMQSSMTPAQQQLVSQYMSTPTEDGRPQAVIPSNEFTAAFQVSSSTATDQMRSEAADRQGGGVYIPMAPTNSVPTAINTETIQPEPAPVMTPPVTPPPTPVPAPAVISSGSPSSIEMPAPAPVAYEQPVQAPTPAPMPAPAASPIEATPHVSVPAPAVTPPVPAPTARSYTPPAPAPGYTAPPVPGLSREPKPDRNGGNQGGRDEPRNP